MTVSNWFDNLPMYLALGVSMIDACIDWETTEKCITATADKLRDVLKARIKD